MNELGNGINLADICNQEAFTILATLQQQLVEHGACVTAKFHMHKMTFFSEKRLPLEEKTRRMKLEKHDKHKMFLRHETVIWKIFSFDSTILVRLKGENHKTRYCQN